MSFLSIFLTALIFFLKLLDNMKIGIQRQHSSYQYIFQPFMYVNGHFTFCSQEFNHRTLSNTMAVILQWDTVLPYAVARSYYCSGLDKKVWGIPPNAIFLTNVFQKKKNRRHYLLTDPRIIILSCTQVRGHTYFVCECTYDP